MPFLGRRTLESGDELGVRGLEAQPARLLVVADLVNVGELMACGSRLGRRVVPVEGFRLAGTVWLEGVKGGMGR